ncbi:GPP34 family phosphoprotein [Saccharopolyspora sp. NPDC000359]|uniref:GOLPH3/VPS74 family protein n=1 Tax=Saccharopolyspora sp. NPDC000359 TaxID=3154251 RepID=UPI0033211F41
MNSLTSRVFLMACDVDGKGLTNKRDLGLVLRGAVLTELAMAGLLADSAGKAAAVGADLPADLVLADALVEVRESPVRWKKLARSHGRETYVWVRDSLIELGVIRVGSRQVLGVVPVERVTAVDPAAVRALQEHVASIVRSTVPVREIAREDAALVGLADAGNLLSKSIAAGELRKHRSRVRALAELGGPAVLAASAAVEHKRRVRLAAGNSG